jgi:ABC-type polysaccharide/polyol phosphate transport system, ATPase component
VSEDIDFEVDPEDLPEHAESTALGDPSVVVHDLHVTYRVFGGRKRPVAGNRLERLVAKGRAFAGAVTEVRAVRGVSFVAHHGESIGIIGTNGSGKSTLLRAIAGLHPPTQGSVYISGVPSLLGVNAALVKRLSGERNIILGGLALGLTREQIEAKFDEIVDFAGIGDAVQLPMSAYSSGMAARLRFAISTAAVPDVLMIDEALATGDAAFRQRSKDRIDEIRRSAGTVFFVSHSLASVRAMCTRAIWLDKGVVRADGPVDEVADEYAAFVKRLRAQGKDDRDSAQ